MADKKMYKVGITVKEPWSADISYEVLDITLYAVENGGDGCSYIAIRANQGVTPGTDDTVWVKATQRGQSIYDLAVKYGDFEGTEAEFEAEYEAALHAAQSAAQSVSDIEARVETNEAARVAAERARSDAETARSSAETARINAENARNDAESLRDTAESDRVRAESGRVTAEASRVEAETFRQGAEQSRRQQFEALKTDMETAIDNVDTKSAEIAEDIEGYEANEAGRVSAENARATAESARVSAEQGRATAETRRAEQAASDHTRAENDHTRAESDHTRAESDHTRAEEAAAAAEHMVDIKQGPQGPQGNTGSSVDYPYELVNNLTTDDATKGLSAAQGVVLDGKVSQLAQEVTDLFVATDADLDLGDENGNVVARFNGGHIKTLNFDSKEYTDKDILSTPNKIDALFVNKFLVDTEHTYNLLNPSDFEGVDSGFIPISSENGTIIHMHFLEYVYYDRATKSTQNITINPFSTFCRFYDSNKDIISVDINNTYQKAIPTNAAFVKVRLVDAKYRDVAWLSYDYTAATYSRGGIEHREYPKELGFTKTGYEDFTIVCFGDSITQGINRNPLNISYVSYLEDILHCHTINVGFGGTRMAYVGASPLFSFANLADVIVSDAADKWDALDDYVSEQVPGYAKHLDNLKNIDWTKVDAISVFYGMNDYAYQGSGTQIGEEGSMDKTTFNGACAYGLDKLLTKYPWLQVILITPYDRYMDASTNSSNTVNSVGKYMKDYADSLIGIQNIFRCPILDFYRESNINKYSYKTMLADGVHAYVYPTVKRLAKMLAECIMNKLY